MKFFLILGFVAFSSCEFDPKTFDWSSVKPLTQTKAYREAFSHLFTVEFLDEELKGSRNRVGRIIGGEVVRPYDYPFQVSDDQQFKRWASYFSIYYLGWIASDSDKRKQLVFWSAYQCENNFIGRKLLGWLTNCNRVARSKRHPPHQGNHLRHRLQSSRVVQAKSRQRYCGSHVGTRSWLECWGFACQTTALGAIGNVCW